MANDARLKTTLLELFGGIGSIRVYEASTGQSVQCLCKEGQ